LRAVVALKLILIALSNHEIIYPFVLKFIRLSN